LVTLYLFFATTHVRNEPIAGELISTMSPGFRRSFRLRGHASH
jgi:hypothetical protein